MPRGEALLLLGLGLLAPARASAQTTAPVAPAASPPASPAAAPATDPPPSPAAPAASSPASGPPVAIRELPTPVAGSHPQINAGLTLGVAGQGQGALWDHTYFHGGLRADVLFGRSSYHDWGIGPLLELSTTHFRDANAGAGLSLLAPVHEYLPIVLGAGAYVRRFEGTHPGLFGSFFWGTRSFNYHGNYGLAAGLLVEGRVGLDDTKERTIVLAAQLDAEILALPALFLINALR